MLEKAGYTQDRIAVVLAKCLVVAEDIIDNPDTDPFAKMAAIKMLVKDIAAVSPIKGPGHQPLAQTPVTINIGDMPPAPKARGQAPAAPPNDSQVIDIPSS